MSSVVLSLVLLVPFTPHTPAEQRVWEANWQERVEENGVLSRKLLAEYVDFQTRHAPQVSSTSITRSTYRGIGDGVEQWRGLVGKYFSDVDRALCIMNAESGGNPNAVNPSSGAAGLFQVMPFWWEKFGGDRFDPETNVRVAAKILGLQGWNAWSPYKRGMCR